MNIDTFFYEIMNSHNKVVIIVDAILFLLFIISVLYLFIFSMASLSSAENKYPKAKINHNFIILYPVFKGESIIIESVKSFLRQEYPVDRYKIITVIDETMQEEIQTLNDMNIITIPIDTQSISKGIALKHAVELIDYRSLDCDVVVVLDADNDVDSDMLQKINDAYYSGCDAVQTHRIAKKRETRVAVLDAVSEEINNSIFRKGHTALGFSSALIGSGMAFDYKLFVECINSCSLLGFDKQMERILLSNNLYIEYLETVFTYDEKVDNKRGFYDQRSRWMASHIYNLLNGIFTLPTAIVKGKWDYCDKLFQWMMPPRLLLFGFIVLISSFFTIYDWVLSIKWWILFFTLCMTFIVAIPNYLVDHKLKDALRGIPSVFILMIIGVLRIRRSGENVIQRLRE